MAVVFDSGAVVGTLDGLTGARRGHHDEAQVLGFFERLIVTGDRQMAKISGLACKVRLVS